MTRINRTIAMFALAGLLMAALAEATQSPSVVRKTVTISGSTGVAGATMQGLPGDPAVPITDENGVYSVQVPYGFSGTVFPIKLGYGFDPPAREYRSVRDDLTREDYAARTLTFTISGQTGMAGVAMTGLPGNPVTDREGRYKVTVEYGWRGVVTPVREGYVFEPPQREYASVTEVMASQDYAAQGLTYRISGNVGMPGVVLKGPPDNPVSDSDGNYSVTVPYRWSGKVTPIRGAYQFEPASREYARITGDLSGMDYVPSVRSLPPFAAGASEILVIPTWEVDLKDFAETREDMQVMLQILRDKLSEPRMILGALYDYGDFFGGAGRTAEAFYLQGQAAVFVLRVDFPLSFPSAPRTEDEREPKPAVDPVWQRARDKLYAPPGAPAYGSRVRPGEADRMSLAQFKEDLLKALRHAANIRNIEPNESVILTVIGQSEEGFESGLGEGMMGGGGHYGGMGGFSGRMMGGYGSGMMGGGSIGMMGGGGGGSVSGGGSFYSGTGSRSGRSVGGGPGLYGTGSASPAPATVLTIQAKKADIDAFAKGELDLEQFREKVRTFTY